MSKLKLSDLSVGDEVFCGLSIYTIKRITPTGRIVTTYKSFAGEEREEIWSPRGHILGGDDWSTRTIKPLTEAHRLGIAAGLKRKERLRIIEKQIWHPLTDAQLEKVCALLKSFEPREDAE